MAAGGSAVGTYAYLTDTGASDVGFQIGSLSIETDPADGELDFRDLDENEINESNIQICNTGTLPVRDVVITGIDIQGHKEVANALEVQEATLDGEDIMGVLHSGDQNGNGIIDLGDVAAHMAGKQVSLVSDLGAGGLQKNESGEGGCKMLSIVTRMDYSVLADGENGREITATINLIGEQEPPESQTE